MSAVDMAFMCEWGRDHAIKASEADDRDAVIHNRQGFTSQEHCPSVPARHPCQWSICSTLHWHHSQLTAVGLDVETDDDDSGPEAEGARRLKTLSCMPMAMSMRRIQRKTQMSQVLILMTYRTRLCCHCWLTLDLVELFVSVLTLVLGTKVETPTTEYNPTPDLLTSLTVSTVTAQVPRMLVTWAVQSAYGSRVSYVEKRYFTTIGR